MWIFAKGPFEDDAECDRALPPRGNKSLNVPDQGRIEIVMCDGITVNLQSIVEFLSNPGAVGLTRGELIDECRDCLGELRRRSAIPSEDKDRGISANPEAKAAVPVVALVLRYLMERQHEAALLEANKALEILKNWVN